MKKHHSTWILALTSLGFFMSMMDSMIVTTASTAIRNDFNISVSQLQWALNAYNVTIAAVLLFGVALGDKIGHRKIYNIGILIFVIGSIACALSSNITMLIIARIIEGAGASVMTPMSMAILTSALAPQERGKALGIWSGIGGFALIVGPALGGMIVANLTWQWIFWINVPIGLVGIYFSQKKLPETIVQGTQLNIIDSILIILASSGLIWALSESRSQNISSSTMIIGIISGLLAIVFLLRQLKEVHPMVPLNLFKRSPFSGGNISTFLLYASMYGVVFFLPQYFQIVNHSNALSAGLKMLPWTGTLVLIAPFAGKAVDQFGERLIGTIGLTMQGIGYLWIAIISSPSTSYLNIVVPLAIAGTGLSLAGPALQKAVVGAVEQKFISQSSGIYNMFRLFGGAIGVTVSVIIFYAYGSATAADVFSVGFNAAMIGAAVISLLGIIPALCLKTTGLIVPRRK
ncbi:MFS transporter [Lentilactobacillus fungorum]|uniref:MFS transporter n=1 Tax=Lentilactobacillus fungorum TaxID=2201250 RepID=A0ABQ3VZH8_9LACO|nr:MFS transporter [Lentilactobacillus fungorum]GHP13980.1 MFS transporter [Lentilactobacillus fungorum]